MRESCWRGTPLGTALPRRDERCAPQPPTGSGGVARNVASLVHAQSAQAIAARTARFGWLSIGCCRVVVREAERAVAAHFLPWVVQDRPHQSGAGVGDSPWPASRRIIGHTSAQREGRRSRRSRALSLKFRLTAGWPGCDARRLLSTVTTGALNRGTQRAAAHRAAARTAPLLCSLRTPQKQWSVRRDGISVRVIRGSIPRHFALRIVEHRSHHVGPRVSQLLMHAVGGIPVGLAGADHQENVVGHGC